MWSRTHDNLYLNYAKTLTNVLIVNFALGVVTGTIVEFGLLDIWPTSILLFASSGFLPLLYEATIAFIGEAVLVVFFLITLGRWRAGYSIALLIVTWFLGSLSGYFILTANAWMNVPWAVSVFMINRSVYYRWCLSPLRAVRYADAVCLSSPYLLINSSCSVEFVVPFGFT